MAHVTKQDEIVAFLRARPGKPYTSTQLAVQFRTTPGNVRQLWPRLREEGWTVEEELVGVTKYYRVYPPKEGV